MRVIAGTWRSRPLEAPAGVSTRPTSDRLRETLFNVLQPRIAGARFLDLYAGSGAIGIEALSRGALHAEFVERAQPALKALRANLAKLGIASASVHAVPVAPWLRRAPNASPDASFDLIFLDPPWDDADAYQAVLTAAPRLLAPDGLLIAEHRRKAPLAASYGPLHRTRLLEQGDAALSFYGRDQGTKGPRD